MATAGPLPFHVGADPFRHLATLAGQVSLEPLPVHEDERSKLLRSPVRDLLAGEIVGPLEAHYLNPRRRDERIAALRDDPEKLREQHRRQIERREARKAARRREAQGAVSGAQHAHVVRPRPDNSETGERSLECANAAPVW